ncbi:hypothetical protein LY76DRAFT_651408 [Colletotrichum caudatum]|nr:hypothetical protein LY76DRAFT_651408 [Colletotrichum caudatum]
METLPSRPSDPSRRPSSKNDRSNRGNDSRNNRDDPDVRDITATSMAESKALLRRRVQKQQQREQQQQQHQHQQQQQQEHRSNQQRQWKKPCKHEDASRQPLKTKALQRHGQGPVVVVLQSISRLLRSVWLVVRWLFAHPKLVVIAFAVIAVQCLVGNQASSSSSSPRSSASRHRDVLSSSVIPSFPSFSDGISDTAVVVADVINGDPDYALYITPTVMPARNVLHNVDSAIRAFSQRLVLEQTQYLRLIHRTENSPALGQPLRSAWLWTYLRRQAQARDIALGQGRQLGKLIEAALSSRNTLVKTLKSKQTLQATLHVSRNTCNWANMLESKPQIAVGFVERLTTVEPAKADEPLTSHDVQVRDLVTTDVSRARVLCSGSNVMASSWKRLEEHVVQRDVEDLRSATGQVQHLLEQVGNDSNDLDPDELNEWEARLVDIAVALLKSIRQVYGRYSEV